MKARRTIRRRLALSAIYLVMAVVVVTAGVAYREVRSAAIRAAGDHLENVSRQLAEMYGTAARQILNQTGAVARDSSIVAYARSPAEHLRAPAIAALQRLVGSTNSNDAELWDAAGRRILDFRADAEVGPDEAKTLIGRAMRGPAGQSAVSFGAISPLDTASGFLGYQVIAAVAATPDARPIGFVVQRRRIVSTSQTIAQLTALIGARARLQIGNGAGGLWTNLSTVVAGPPMLADTGGVLEYTRAGDEPVLAAMASIANTPWLLSVESPRGEALASARMMLWRLAAITVVLLALGALGAWWMAGTVTRPIATLAGAVQAIGERADAPRIPVDRDDELGVFAEAFNAMSDRISASRRDLEAKVRELADAEARYRLLFDESPQPMWVYDLETNQFLAVNSAAIARYGYSREQFLAMTILEIRPAEDVPALLDDLRRLGHERGAESDIWRHRTSDGQLIDVEVDSRALRFDGRPARLVVANDLTERRRAEAAARAARDRLERVIGASAAVLYDVRVEDGMRRLEWMSGNVQSVLGYDADEAQGDAWWMSGVHPDDRDRVARARSNVSSGGTIEYRFRHKDGSYRWIRDEARVVSGDDASVRVIGALVDATKQHQVEAQLQHGQRMEAVGRLAGGVAHDFNNLLTVMLAECHMLLDEPEMPLADRVEAVEEVRKAAERAALLTRQLLAFSRRQLVEATTLDLNGVVTDVDKMLRRLIGEDVELRLRLHSQAVAALADRGQLEQVIINLAVNARDAMPGGGTLTIETGVVSLDDDYAAAHPDAAPGDYAVLSVSDTGSGMTDAVKDHAFEPFFTTKEAGKGTGLGLATCYAIVRQFKGHISVYSEVGIGTTMKVYLPLTEADAPRAKPLPELRSPRRPATVLLVEDDPSVRRLTAKMLTSQGYTVLQAGDAQQAIAVVEQTMPAIHLLLTDVVLPRVGGRALAERISTLRPGIHVLFMSGYSDDVVLQHQLTEHDALLIQKPFTAAALVAKVEQALGTELRAA